MEPAATVLIPLESPSQDAQEDKARAELNAKDCLATDEDVDSVSHSPPLSTVVGWASSTPHLQAVPLVPAGRALSPQ